MFNVLVSGNQRNHSNVMMKILYTYPQNIFCLGGIHICWFLNSYDKCVSKTVCSQGYKRLTHCIEMSNNTERSRQIPIHGDRQRDTLEGNNLKLLSFDCISNCTSMSSFHETDICELQVHIGRIARKYQKMWMDNYISIFTNISLKYRNCQSGIF